MKTWITPLPTVAVLAALSGCASTTSFNSVVSELKETATSPTNASLPRGVPVMKRPLDSDWNLTLLATF